MSELFSYPRFIPKSVTCVIDGVILDIINGVLLPGARLIEDYLILRYNSKRHVVRLALTELQHLGIVEKPPRLGAQIRRFSSEELHEIYEMRITLASIAIDKIILPIDKIKLNKIKETLHEHKKLVKDENFLGIHQTNLLFHKKIYALCNNRFLVDAIDYNDWLSFTIRAYNITDYDAMLQSSSEHEEMFFLLISDNLNELKKLTISHMNQAKETYIKRFGS